MLYYRTVAHKGPKYVSVPLDETHLDVVRGFI